MYQVLNDITSYIDFLRANGWCVMVSCFDSVFGECLPTLLEYETHQLPICAYLKSQPNMMKRCIKNKNMLKNKKITCTYYSHCYAGIEEYVYPAIFDNKTIMCINISGYMGKTDRSVKAAHNVVKRCDKKVADLYSNLFKIIPEISDINQIIRPLEYMVCELYRQCKERPRVDSTSKMAYRQAITYIYDHFNAKITRADVAEAVGYSEVYLRSIFRRECHKSIMEYINDIRLQRASEMLSYTSQTITDIAFLCGFSDSNYFSTAFKKKYGVPPKEYRKNM